MYDFLIKEIVTNHCKIKYLEKLIKKNSGKMKRPHPWPDPPEPPNKIKIKEGFFQGFKPWKGWKNENR